MMNRKYFQLAGVVALVFLAYAAASWQAGSRIMKESDAATEALNTYLGKTWSEQVVISPASYDRGIFTSRATYTLSFPNSNETSTKPEVLIVNQIQHGPFPASEVLNGRFGAISAVMTTTLAPTPFTEALFKTLQGQSLVHGKTIIHLDGKTDLDWTARPLDFTRNGTRTNFSGGSLKAEVGPQFSYRKGELSVQSLSVADEKSSFDIRDSRIHTDVHANSYGLNLGISGAAIGSITVTSPTAPAFKAEKIHSQFVLKDKGDLLEGSAEYEVGALSINQKDWGNIKFSANYDKLEGRALKTLIDLNASMMARSVNNSPEADLVNSQDIKQFWQALHTLSQSGPSLKISSLAWQTKAGLSQLVLNAVFTATNVKSNGIGLVSNPIASLDATLSLSRPMIADLLMQSMQNRGMSAAQAKARTDTEIKTMLSAVSQFKFGKFENDKLTVKMSFENNAFTVNGHKLSIDSLFQFLSTAVPTAWLEEEATTQDRPDETAEIKHLEPSVLASILTAADFIFEETKDDQGDPLLKVRPGNSGAEKIEFSFIGCGIDPTCEDVLLRATYAPNRTLALKVVNNWNLRNRWARAYINEKNEAVIEMDISAYGGIGRDAVEAMVNMFFKIVGDFSKELEQQK